MPVPGAPPGAAASSQMTGADILRVLRANIWLILIMVVGFAVAGYALNQYLLWKYPRYTAIGLVQVTPPRRIAPTPVEMTNLTEEWSTPQSQEIELLTQAQLLKTDALFNLVLTDSTRVRQTEWFQSFQSPADALDDLRDRFKVTAMPNTRLVRVAMSTRNDRDAVTIVEEVVQTHLNQQRQRRELQARESTAYLKRIRDMYDAQVRDIDARLRQRAIDLNISGGGVPGRLSAKEIELQGLLAELLKAQFEVDAAEQMLAAFQNDLRGSERPRQIEAELQRDQELFQWKQQLVNADLRLQEVRARYGDAHEQTRSAMRMRDAMQKIYDDRRAELTNIKITEYLGALQAAVEGGRAKLGKINEAIDRVKTELGELSFKMSGYLTLAAEEKGYQELLKQVNDNLNAHEQALNWNLAQVDWQDRPQRPDMPSFPRLPITLSLAVVLGLGLSLTIAFLREMLDTRIRSPRDVARVGPMNLLGIVSDESEDPQSAGARLPLIIAEAPHSVLAEHMRQMRTRLQQAAPLDAIRSILITSPGPGDGKSTIATNLAAGLALNGRRILLVDANFRRPEIHKIFGVPNARGFAEALTNLESFDSIVQQTHVPNLSVLTTGTKPANPTELLESQLLIDLLERALEEYDHVIFDGPPLLFASEAVAMAPRVDGVVTVVRARTNSRGVLQRVRDTLRQIKAEHLGVVLNAVRSQGGGYYSRNIKTYYSYQGNGN